MPNLPSGKGQLNITGVRKETIAVFKQLCEEQGRKQGRQFEIILEEWLAQKKETTSASFSTEYGKMGKEKEEAKRWSRRSGVSL